MRYNIIIIINLEKGVGLYEGIVNVTSLTQNMNISITNSSAILFLFFFGSVTLVYVFLWYLAWLSKTTLLISNVWLRIFFVQNRTYGKYKTIFLISL